MGVTALIYASLKGYTDTVNTLLSKGADTGTKDHLGRTAEMMASVRGHDDTVKTLLGNKTDFFAADASGMKKESLLASLSCN